MRLTAPALAHPDGFSRVVVLWWADSHDNPESRSALRCELPYAPGVEAGVFACRAGCRPNPIGLRACPILRGDAAAGGATVAVIDALGGTPIIDLKPDIGVTARGPRDHHAPWFEGWPEWPPEEGRGLSPGPARQGPAFSAPAPTGTSAPTL